MRLRRLVWLVPAVLLAAVAYCVWLAWQVRADLAQADAAVDDLRAALEQEDAGARDRAVEDLTQAASDARGHTDSAWWGLMTHFPLVGDDATGIRALTRSLDTVAADGARPLVAAVDRLPGLMGNGGVDLRRLEEVRPTVLEAGAAFDRASDQVHGLDSSGYAGSIRARFDDYVETVDRAAHVLDSAATATTVLPEMLGADGPRTYLLVFQNNAEIRATGGMPGSWAQLRADDGKLSMLRQGTAGDFPVKRQPPLQLTPGELAVYEKTYGIYFQDIGFAPDFPRAAELAQAHWDQRFPAAVLDGVLALDPVAMSYLLEGTGPVPVGDRTLTPENAVSELLSRPYLELNTVAQDAFFAESARAVFDAVTGDLADPMAFVEAVSRSVEERRLQAASFHPETAEALAGTRVAGELSGDDGATPHVDIGLNDATASKMSYYLRYTTEVRAASCADGAQLLRGTMSLRQSIPPSEAAQLPDSVTGGGIYGNDPGDQLVFVRIYGPYGGGIEDIRMDGRALDPKVVDVDGRPVVTLIVQLSTADAVDVNWSMRTGADQTGDIEVGVTPGVLPGSRDVVVASAC